ncbi:hypothetical protein D6C90_08295 [Aureobasidium pullulans]|uniref:Glycosyltransferase 2-like domain-containing protein n=1 Tax=Aureobasidium pullulans TaxID=5580 RepID=A0A4S9U8E3_AURPU|nr:hypothetical protein D6C90_08295 [Aureobasidium pullulans]
MGVAHWIVRCTPFISVSILLLLRFLAFYIVLLHLAAWWFPIRLCWALFDLLRKLKRTATEYVPNQAEDHYNNAGNADKPHGTTIHAILIPNYKEEIETLSDTLRVLSAHPMAERAYDVILAMEENETGAESKARKLQRDFAGRFRRLSRSMHPSNLEGETKGKSSNLSWVAKQAAAYYAKEPNSEVILTMMDADTHLLPYHFESISRLHSENPSTCKSTMYVPHLIFDRNMHAIPLLVRLADMLWCGADLACLHSTSTVCIPTSIYSLPLSLAETVGGWDAGPESIGEDMRMYLNPASQCNVASGEMGWRGYKASLVARYQQAIRHTWGALDVGYTLEKLWHLFRSSSKAARDSDDIPSALEGLSYIRLTKGFPANEPILYPPDDHGTALVSDLPFTSSSCLLRRRHTTLSLTRDATFHSMYLDPLERVLRIMNADSQVGNVSTDSKQGVFSLDPGQTLVLLVDLKTSGHETYAKLDEQLQSLRDDQWLTHWNGTHRVERPITIVVSGHAPFGLIAANDSYRDIFFDAPLTSLASDGDPAAPTPTPGVYAIHDNSPGSGLLRYKYNPSNSWYASSDFKAAGGILSIFAITDPQIRSLAEHMRMAEARGLVPRYWGTPRWPRSLRDQIWEVLLQEGVGILNVDDLRAARKGSWGRWGQRSIES